MVTYKGRQFVSLPVSSVPITRSNFMAQINLLCLPATLGGLFVNMAAHSHGSKGLVCIFLGQMASLSPVASVPPGAGHVSPGQWPALVLPDPWAAWLLLATFPTSPGSELPHFLFSTSPEAPHGQQHPRPPALCPSRAGLSLPIEPRRPKPFRASSACMLHPSGIFQGMSGARVST